MARVQKAHPQFDLRLPITLPILRRITDALDHCSLTVYQKAMYKSMFLLAFSAFLRVGELSVSNNNTANVLKLDNVMRSHDTGGLKLVFQNFKHSQGRQACIDIERQDNVHCPVQSLLNYLEKRAAFKSVFLYCWSNGKPVSRRTFSQILKSTLMHVGLNPTIYTAHSFRIGAACHAVSRGYSDAQIREMGRWQSDAFKKYIRM